MKQLRLILPLVCEILFSSLLYSSTDSITVLNDPFKVANIALGSDINYLKAITELKKGKEQYLNSPQVGMYMQAAMTYNTMLLNNKETSNLYSDYFKSAPLKLDSLNFIAENYSAINSIVKMSEGRQVVMINEIHWFTKERYLMNLLLKDFYDKGFRYLAIEAISENADSLMMRKYPIASTGFYTMDPRMSNMIREAIERGFILINYDFYGQDREYKQAENIYNKTLKLDPFAKVLVYAGGDHNNKCESDNKMGALFKKISGIEPFVIKQTKQVQTSRADYKGIAIEDSPNLCVFDLAVINGLSETDFLFRPNVRQTSISIRDFVPSLSKLSLAPETSFMSIYVKKEFQEYSLKAIPIASYLIDASFPNLTIKLPHENYIITIRDIEGKIIAQDEIKLE